jgi:hypothetical protein
MHWHVHKVGARHYAEYEKRNQRMEVAVALGGDPAITYAADIPPPRGDPFAEQARSYRGALESSSMQKKPLNRRIQGLCFNRLADQAASILLRFCSTLLR